MAKSGNDEDISEDTDELESEVNSLENGTGKKKPKKPDTRYHKSLAYVFKSHHKPALKEIPFKREELTAAGKKLKLKPLKNLGDAIYSYRYRIPLPQEIASTAPEGYSWVIMPAGKGKYRFELIKGSPFIQPRTDAAVIKIPDATPEIITANDQGDEQAVLARIRYNRLIDIFLGLTAYSLQNHFRTFVKDIGQIETDEVYVGVNKQGQQFVIPVQAKGGTDLLAVIQTKQDIACCREKKKLRELTCRPVSAQFMADKSIALFELLEEEGGVRVAEERHYKLVPSSEITAEDRARYALKR
jgi:hypothetical protein